MKIKEEEEQEVHLTRSKTKAYTEPSPEKAAEGQIKAVQKMTTNMEQNSL